ncbi:MAG: hypothetical protein KJP11_09230 [Gammaproteobacteria bacterium]|nr:hypothetical protein [Gammaproteobacteria bacterium]
MLSLSVATAQTDQAEATSQAAETQKAQSVRKLLAIREALEEKRERIRELLEQVEAAGETEKETLNQQIDALRETIGELTRSFENIAVGGANLRNLTDAEGRKLDWRDELLQITRPLLNSLKEATEKPRRIEELRSAIKLYEQQLEVTRKATESIALFDQSEMPPLVAEGLAKIAASWQERSEDIERSLEISRVELRNLEQEKVKIFETISRVSNDFFLGRGLTLLLALVTGIVLWFAMKALRRLVKSRRHPAQLPDHAAKIRLLLYGYHLLTILLVSMAVLSVFYIRGDLLLLTLAIIALVMLALGAWRYLPRYVQEARLLLNIAAAREGERVIYNGLPFHIASLNLYSELRNPELEGAIRLPLSALAQLTSRPRTDEDWFPCRAGDYVLLPDGNFGQVLQQTVELVRLKVIGSVVQFGTAEFLQLNVRNLSREGFGVIVVFGIDYQHQEISLTRVPERFMSGLKTAFEEANYGDDLKNLLVEFKQAGTNSLDYLIYATMEGSVAASYFTITRLIQQTCVDICNHEGWVIPFTQVTLHQADDEEPADIGESLAQPV